MAQNKYYVSAKRDNLDLGMVVEAENYYCWCDGGKG